MAKLIQHRMQLRVNMEDKISNHESFKWQEE